MKHILIAYGTRPEYIKLAPLIKELQKHYTVCVVKVDQQPDLCKDFYFDKLLDITNLIDSNRLGILGASILLGANNINWGEFTDVIVQGDTATAFFIALAAFHSKVGRIHHIEAGMRSYSPEPFPEEIYRSMISRIATHHYCSTIKERCNLEKEYLLKCCY